MYGLTSSLINTGSIPKNGIMGKPGLGVESLGAGRGVIIIPPVSSVKYHVQLNRIYMVLPVCHHVSTTVHLPSPITL